MVRRLCLLPFLLLLGYSAGAQAYFFDYNARCQQAYHAYMSLRPDDGDALIRKEFASNPHNLMATYLADYGDFMELFFNGDPSQLKQRQSHQAARLDLLARGSSQDPWQQFCRAGIQMHWAIIYGRFGEQFRAATTFRKSYVLIKENKQRFPAFAQNDLFLGVEEAVAGTIPEEYGWLAAIFGMKGNVRRGAARISDYLEQTSSQTPLRQEAMIYELYIRFYLLFRQQDAARAANALAGNALNNFVQANIMLNYHKASPALSVLRGMMKDPAWNHFPVFEYELANALYMALDESCVPHFLQYAARNKGRLYTKDALMKCALFYYLSGNRAKGEELRRRIKTSGNEATDADKQAQRFAAGAAWPNALLLRARIETEGGNYAAALNRLKGIKPQSFTDPADRLEYIFRTGRTYEGIGDAVHAAQYYEQAIGEGRKRKEQFAARASLQLALMNEQGGRREEALRYFNQCLAIRGHDFQSSIDQQAKAGVNRLTAR